MEFKNLNIQYLRMKEDIDNAINEVIQKTNFISGKPIEELERELADYVGVPSCAGCANGTEALSLALMAWGIGIGDAVFVPDFTFFASGEVVAYAGATPIFVDVEEDTYNIDCVALERAIVKTISEKKLCPKAIIAVDLFGQPADYIRIAQIAEKYQLKILEDGAQGFGGAINGKKACSFGDISTTSFFPVKPLGCYGDGGAVFLKDKEEEILVRSFQIHGKGKGKYDNVRVGINSRLDTMQAAILKVKFKAFRQYELEKVNQLAERYCEELQEVVDVPVIREGFFSSWAQYTIRLKSKKERDGLHEYLGQKDIPSMVYYPKPMHKQLAFEPFFPLYDDNEYKVTNQLCNTVLSLPLYPYMEEADMDRIIKEIKRFIHK